MSFKRDVEKIREISTCYQKGLRALAGYSKRVKCNDTSNIGGSVHLDECVKEIYPDSARWDYIVSHQNQNFFIEVHPATTGEVKVVINKVRWLKKWLKVKAVALNNNKARNQPFRWVSSGKVAIAKKSKYARQLAQNGISEPQRITRLD